MKDIFPSVPMMNLRQIVGTHEPDETAIRKPDDQFPQRFSRESAADLGFDVGHSNVWMIAHDPGLFQAFMEWGHPDAGFQRILWRDHPPHFVKTKGLDRGQRNVAVTLVCGIERATQDANAPSLHAWRLSQRLLGPSLAIALDHVFVACQLLDTDRTSSV